MDRLIAQQKYDIQRILCEARWEKQFEMFLAWFPLKNCEIQNDWKVDNV